MALYFIGCVGDEVIYLDPHTTQKSGSVGNKETEEKIEMDLTYHCKYASRINILSMDPSVAVVSISLLTFILCCIAIQTCFQCFFCKTESEFEDLCHLIREKLIASEKQPLFEICHERPQQWSPLVDDSAVDALGASVLGM